MYVVTRTMYKSVNGYICKLLKLKDMPIRNGKRIWELSVKMNEKK